MKRGRSASFNDEEVEIIFCSVEDIQILPLTPSSTPSTEATQWPSPDKCEVEPDEDDEEDVPISHFRRERVETRQMRRSVTPHVGDNLCIGGQALPTPSRSGLWQRRRALSTTAEPDVPVPDSGTAMGGA